MLLPPGGRYWVGLLGGWAALEWIEGGAKLSCSAQRRYRLMAIGGEDDIGSLGCSFAWPFEVRPLTILWRYIIVLTAS